MGGGGKGKLNTASGGYIQSLLHGIVGPDKAILSFRTTLPPNAAPTPKSGAIYVVAFRMLVTVGD